MANSKKSQQALAKNPKPARIKSKDDEDEEYSDDRQKPSAITSDGGILQSINTARQFLREVVIEFNKITWPGRAQVVQETYSVLFLVTIITLMVLSFDWVLGKAVFGPLEYWARLHGGGVGHG